VNKGRSMKRNKGIRSQPDHIESEINGQEALWGTKSREIISQGPAIQTMVSPRGYVSSSRELQGEKRVTPNHRCVPSQIERHAMM
jgi:hypothetical protein